MRDDRRNYIVVGCFVIAMVAALILWVALLSDFLGRSDSYYIVYRNVTGLAVGNKVLFEGYRVGKIEAIEAIERDGRQRYRVDVSVVHDWRIPEDSEAAIEAPSLLSAVAIDIKAGESARALAPGGEIRGREFVNLGVEAGAVVDQLGELIEAKVQPMVESIAERAPEVIDGVAEFTDDLNETLGRVSEMLGPETRDRLHRILLNVDEATAEANAFVAELRETGGQVDSTLTRVDGLIARNEGSVDESLMNLHTTLEALARRIDAIAYNLEATTRNMNEFSREIRNNPGLILRGREVEDEPGGSR